MSKRQKLLLSLALLTSFSCGGGDKGGSPTAPSRVPAGLTVASLTASREQNASEDRYAINLSVRETGGQTGATMGNIELSLANDDGPVAAPVIFEAAEAWPSTRLNPGATLAPRRLIVTDDRAGHAIANRVTARILYVDDVQTSGATSATASISQPSGPPPPAATHTIAGVVSQESDGRAVVGAIVQVVDGVNAGRSSTTDGNGYYSIPGLRVASFTIRATRSGYHPADRGLTLSGDTRVDLTMRLATPTPPPPPDDSMTCTTSPSTAPCGRPTARCNDGTYSCSQNASGTCSSHGGVACWICPGPLCRR